MSARALLLDIKPWILAALIAGMLTGDIVPYSSEIMILSLMLLMCVSLQGLDFSIDDIRDNARTSLWSLILCYGVSAASALAMALFFTGDIRTGWILIAVVPSAISVIPCTLLLKGNTKLSVVSSTVIYFSSILLAPLMTVLFLATSADPWDILLYSILFIVIPLLVSKPLKTIEIPMDLRLVLLNMLFFIMIWLALASNMPLMQGDPWLLLALIIGCAIRLVLVGIVIEFFLRYLKIDRLNRIPYVFFATWKNTGLAMAMGLVLFSPQAALPGAVSMIVEMIWFLFMVRFIYPVSATGRSSNA